MGHHSSNNEPVWLKKITDTLDQRILGVQVGLYGLGCAGLLIAVRRVRPFQKFSRPSSIPRRFIEQQEVLQGKVHSAELKGGSLILQTSHTPPIPLGRAGKPPYLPVALAGVSPTQLGLSWLQVTLENQPITFTVLATTSDAAIARVTCNGTDVNRRLIALGFARLVPFDNNLKSSNTYKKLYSQLLRSERSAERHGNGIWNGNAPIYWKIIDRIISRLRLLMLQTLPKKLVPAPIYR